MKLIKIIRTKVKKFSEIYDIRKYRVHAADTILVHHYTIASSKIRINNRK